MYRRQLFVLLFILFLRFPSWLLPPVRDAIGYSYIGTQIAQGAIMYKEVWDHKPPGIDFLDAVIYKAFPDYMLGLIVVDYLIGLLSFFLFYTLMQQFFSRRDSFYSSLFFAVASNVYMLTQGINMVEYYMVPVLITTYYLFMRAVKTERSVFFLTTGICVGVLFIFKQVGILPLFAVGLYMLWEQKNLVRRIVLIGSGLLLSLLPLAMYFIRNNALFEAIDAIFLYNIAYSGRGYDLPALGQSLFYLIQVFVSTMPFWLITAIGLSYIKVKRADMLFLLFLVCAFVGTALGGSFAFTRNYFLLTIPPAGYFVTVGIQALRTYIRENRSLAKVALLTLACLFAVPFILQTQVVFAGLHWNGKFHPGERQLQYSLGLPNHNFLQEERVYYAIAEYLSHKTRPGDIILDWGAEPEVYLRTKTHAPTRYFYNFPLNGVFMTNDPKLEERRTIFIEEINAHKPLYIVINNEKVRHQPAFVELDFPAFTHYISENYLVEHTIDNYLLFKLKTGNDEAI